MLATLGCVVITIGPFRFGGRIGKCLERAPGTSVGNFSCARNFSVSFRTEQVSSGSRAAVSGTSRFWAALPLTPDNFVRRDKRTGRARSGDCQVRLPRQLQHAHADEMRPIRPSTRQSFLRVVLKQLFRPRVPIPYYYLRGERTGGPDDEGVGRLRKGEFKLADRRDSRSPLRAGIRIYRFRVH
jgi:hypothetical protein